MKKTFYLLFILCFVFFSSTVHAQSWAWAEKGAVGIGVFAEAMCVDAAGNTYVAGEFNNTPPTMFGSFSLSSSDMDIFVAKYDASGTCLWAKPIILSVAGDEISDIAVNSSGECFVTGWFQGTATFGSLASVASNGGKDIFVAKCNASTGAAIWIKKLGNSLDNLGSKLAVDGSGNCYVSGSFSGSITFAPLSTISGNLFIVKLNNAGTPQWVRSGSSIASVTDIRIDGNGGCNMFGTLYNGALTFGTVTMTPTAGKTAAFLMRFNSTTGASLWGINTTVGNATGTAMDVDANNDIVIGGTSDATTMFGSTPLANGGSGSTYLAKYNTSGAVQLAQQISVTNVDDIDTDCKNNIYLTGNDLSISGNSLYVKKYNASASSLWSVTGSVTPFDYYYADFEFVGVDQLGNVYTTGNQNTSTFGSTTLTGTNLSEFYLAKITFPTPIITGTLICTHSGSTTLTVTNPLPDYTYSWYTTPTGGTPSGTGTSYTTPVIYPGFVPTYYLDASSTTNCQTLNRIPITITVDNSCCPTVISPVASDALICNNQGTATLTVSNQQSGYMYAWYPTLTSTSELSGLPTYTTTTLTATNTFTYYVQAFNSTGCTAPRVGVTVTVNNSCCPTYVAPILSDVHICTNKSAAFAVANPQPNYVYTWYTASTGGTSIATGTSYASPNLTATTSYYVETSNSTSTCPPSSRVAVTATVDNNCCTIANLSMPTTQQNPEAGADVTYVITITNPGTSALNITNVISVPSTPSFNVTSINGNNPLTSFTVGALGTGTITVVGTYTDYTLGTPPPPFDKCFSVKINGCAFQVCQPTVVWDPLGYDDASFSINGNNVPIRTSQAVNFVGNNFSGTNYWYVKPAGGSYTLLSGSGNTVSYAFPDLGNYYVLHNYGSNSLTKAVTVTGENRALAFSTAEVSVGTNTNYGIGNFTLEAYIKPTTLPTALNSKSCFFSNMANTDGFEFGVNASGKLYLQINNSIYTNTAGTTLVNGTCYHVAVTRSTHTFTFYVNGTASGSTFTTSDIPSYNEATLFIGRSAYSDGYSAGQFIGLIEDARIWNIARTQSQISSNIYNTLVGNESGLLSYWPINEGSGTVINDVAGPYSGYVNSGSLSGQTWTTLSCGGARENNNSTTEYQNTSENVSIYPVPFTTETHLTIYSSTDETVSLSITDIMGSTVYKVDGLNSNTEYSIGKDLTSGIYTVIVRCGEKVEYKKIVKQ